MICLCQLNCSILHFQSCNVHACSQIVFMVHFQTKMKVHLKELKMSGVDNRNQQLFAFFLRSTGTLGWLVMHCSSIKSQHSSVKISLMYTYVKSWFPVQVCF